MKLLLTDAGNYGITISPSLQQHNIPHQQLQDLQLKLAPLNSDQSLISLQEGETSPPTLTLTPNTHKLPSNSSVKVKRALQQYLAEAQKLVQTVTECANDQASAKSNGNSQQQCKIEDSNLEESNLEDIEIVDAYEEEQQDREKQSKEEDTQQQIPRAWISQEIKLQDIHKQESLFEEDQTPVVKPISSLGDNDEFDFKEFEEYKRNHKPIIRMARRNNPLLARPNRKVYNVMNGERKKDLESDIAMGTMSKEELMRRYRISHSTLIRRIREFMEKRERGEIIIRDEFVIPAQSVQPVEEVTKRKRVGVKELAKLHNSRKIMRMRLLYARLLRGLDMQKVVFVDELRFRKVVNMGTKYSIPDEQYGAVAEVNMIIALKDSQVLDYRLQNKAIKEKQFGQFMTRINQATNGDHTFILDTHPLHRSSHTQIKFDNQQIKTLFFPPISRQLNPIFHFFESFKKELATKVFDSSDYETILQEVHRAMSVLRFKGRKQPFFQTVENYLILALSQLQFPIK